MEKVTDAQNDFKKAVDLIPDFGIAYVQKCYTDYRYAVVSKDMDMITAVMKDFDRAFEKFPHCAECYTLYAQVKIFRNSVKFSVYSKVSCIYG